MFVIRWGLVQTTAWLLPGSVHGAAGGSACGNQRAGAHPAGDATAKVCVCTCSATWESMEPSMRLRNTSSNWSSPASPSLPPSSVRMRSCGQWTRSDRHPDHVHPNQALKDSHKMDVEYAQTG